MVARDATVRLPAAERASLEGELRQAVRLFGALHFAAQQVGDRSAEATFQGFLARYRKALAQVQDGPAVDAAACKGTGGAVQGKRFKHFRCGVTSESIEIPQTELDYGDRELPLVIEGPTRILGPYRATLDIHVTGRSSIAYRQAA
ncbi:MAG TPA: hypothetical protein VFR32_09280 [Gaiellaceae bacterium]|nr:hypothetical protein [Gaiellaceae bacterium]